MAERIVRTMTDDLSLVSSDEDPSVATRYFSFDGIFYEVDLNDRNHKLMAEALLPFIEVARTRKASRRETEPKPPRTAASRTRSKEIRAWAEANGYLLAERGRIKAEIVRKFDAAHS